jgi:hypothetical protein
LEEGGVEAILHYRDPIQALASLFWSPRKAKGFCLTPQIQSSSNGKRVYTTPDTCEWWEAMQVLTFKCPFNVCKFSHKRAERLWFTFYLCYPVADFMELINYSVIIHGTCPAEGVDFVNYCSVVDPS